MLVDCVAGTDCATAGVQPRVKDSFIGVILLLVQCTHTPCVCIYNRFVDITYYVGLCRFRLPKLLRTAMSRRLFRWLPLARHRRTLPLPLARHRRRTPNRCLHALSFSHSCDMLSGRITTFICMCTCMMLFRVIAVPQVV